MNGQNHSMFQVFNNVSFHYDTLKIVFVFIKVFSKDYFAFQISMCDLIKLNFS